MVENLNERYLLIGGVVTLLLGITVGFFGFPALLNHQIASSLALKKGSEIRDIWSDIPEAIPFKIFLFNVTNPMEVQQGKKPVIQEIGPYYFEEHKEKVNLEDSEKEDTVSFNAKDTWLFKKEKSGDLTGEEIITIPNIVLTGMALRTEMEKPSALALINKGIRQIFGDPTSIFISAPAMQIMFKGVPFFCNVTEFSSKAICGEIRKEDKDFHKLNENVYGFSLFGMKNGTARDRLKVKRGIKDIKELGQVVEHNGKKEMDMWSGKYCNKIMGTDSTIFAPFITDKDNIVAFAFDLCRSIIAYNDGETTYKGLKGFTYNSGFGDMSTDTQLKCFCNTPDTCLKQGMHDLTRCFGIPMAASYPHFYDAHPDYSNGVIGLNPTKEKHGLAMILEPLTGTPMVGYKRLQFSLALHKIDKIDLMKEIPTVMLPIFWVEEGLDLDDKYLDKLRSAHGAIKMMNIVKWIMIAAGGSLAIAGFFVRRFKKTADETTELKPDKLKFVRPVVTPLEINTPPKY